MDTRQCRWIGGGLVGLVLLVSVPAQAVPLVTPTVTELGGGVFEYRYDVANPASSSETLYDFGLFGFTGALSNVLSPTGWDAIFGSDPVFGSFIDWFSLDPLSDLVAGASLGGFSFESLVGPGEAQFTSLGYDAGSGEVGVPVTGPTVGPNPTPVPEPGPLLLVGWGLVGLGVARRRALS
jgi:hypothetical protein